MTGCTGNPQARNQARSHRTTACAGSVVQDRQDLESWPAEHRDLSLDRVRKLVVSQAVSGKHVYVYTVASTRLDSGIIQQLGSGPNVEGGLLTLCTCKHHMRTWGKPEDWKGVWLCGATSSAGANGFAGHAYLFYMGKVRWVFDSHQELYESLRDGELGRRFPGALDRKLATHHQLGDIFEPRRGSPRGTRDPAHYVPPIRGHSHEGQSEWHHDIRQGKLLVCDPEDTYLWTRPLIELEPVGRGVRRYESLGSCDTSLRWRAARGTSGA